MDKQIQFILRRFSQYYEKADFSIPEIEKREFGAGIEKKIDSRHMHFHNGQEFRSFLVNNTPLYVSHSVAYYALPGATPMERKCWLGADLVFDLDFETESKYLNKQDFEKIRDDAVRLLEEFIIPDFGVRKENVLANFSGNRGFHLHVRDPRFNLLRGDERRELLEYIKGTGLNYDSFFLQDQKGFRINGPVPSESGYAGRFAKKVLGILEGEPEKLSRVFKDQNKRINFINGIKGDGTTSNWSMKSITPGVDAKLRAIAEKELPLRGVNVDAGVTQDVSKLIRVANSIHGSTGMSAKILRHNELPSFEPMHNALIFDSQQLKISAIEDIPEIEMGNSTQEKIEKGKTKEVPEYFAIYLKLKGSADILI